MIDQMQERITALEEENICLRDKAHSLQVILLSASVRADNAKFAIDDVVSILAGEDAS